MRFAHPPRCLLSLAARFTPFVIMLLLPVLVSCGRPQNERTGNEQLYDLRGKVVSVDARSRTISVEHEEIPGFMEAMTMDFTLEHDDALKVAAPGDTIQATLVVGDRSSWLENPVITKVASGTAPEVAAEGPSPGTTVPDFRLVNQNEKKIGRDDYRGRALLLTFIYTRCPLPDYCPLMSTNFAQINRELEKDPALASRAHLLSVSVDPDFDTPKVLRSYGAAHTENYLAEKFETWEFATGTPEEIRKLAEFFGLSYYPEKEQIIHSLRTAVITPDGRVQRIFRGNEWKPEEALAELRKAAG